ncbi:adhesion G protein-coupled receptor A3-like isoform X2 [Scleropages formosus]|uniref:adhesion G protein-coupled receptor A3-like isoform X2 n=1 Tax=Scleropages formosus TaxID=113540 RepID=UPI0010FA9A29|nr:adhesion G protein-coupled receptor A3-like isoform X2 [Scleropages formosus]
MPSLAVSEEPSASETQMGPGFSAFLRVAALLLPLLGSAASPFSVADCKSYDERPRSASSASRTAGTGSAGLERKVVCSNMDIGHVTPSRGFPERTVTLILSNNKIQELKNGSFMGLSALERLDIRNNIISHIEPGAFLGLLNLRRLDLSNNRIGCMRADMFAGLPGLARLNLSGNMFSSVPPGTFDSLTSLKTVELQTAFLLCDCSLLWLLHWAKERGVAMKDTRCSYPRALRGQPIASLQPDLLTCDAPLELPSFQMTPSQRQIVFRGDSLPFRCLASYVDKDMQVLWFQDGRMVEPNATEGIFIEKSVVQNCSLIASALTLSNVQPGSTGSWECLVSTRRGNSTRAVPIVVLESSAKHCPPDRVTNNKGEFRWPRTLAGITAYLPCSRPASGTGIYAGTPGEEQRASRGCGIDGRWAEENYSHCQYSNDVTRVLSIINQMPLNLTNAVTTARQLLVYTVEATTFSDKMDIIFVAQMIEKFGRFAEKYKELGDVMVDISSNLMLADERLLWLAQWEAQACSRVLECLQRIASHRLTSGVQGYTTNSHNIALEAHTIKASSFNGMTCTLFQKVTVDRGAPRELSGRSSDVNLDRQLSFKCNVSSTLSSVALKNTVLEASIQLPPSLLSKLPGYGLEETVYRLQLLAFRNGKLFPSTSNSSLLADQGSRRAVASPVILISIDGHPLTTLQSPVNVMLRRFTHGSDPVAAHWNSTLLDGQGDWDPTGCHILRSDSNFTTISCNLLGSYAVLTDASGAELFPQATPMLHPVVYATAAILLLCLLAVISSYICHHRSVRISRKSWHMLVNLCLHILLSCVVYVGGVTQVGIVLHYSTLATVLWVGVTARNIYKQVTRKAKSYEELDEPPPPPRPMLRFYLIGGGIPIIVCGITAAANIRNYGSQVNAPYCWMAWEPSLGAFYGPVGFIVLVDCLYLLSILVQLHRHPDRRYELKDVAEEEQRLQPDGPLPAVSQSNQLTDPPAGLENEHSFWAQLLGVSVALVLFVALWAAGALAVSQEPPLDLLFSCLFGVVALGLGSFLVTHHCTNREDMRRLWLSACCPGRWDYLMQVDGPLAKPSTAKGCDPKSSGSGAESSCTNKSTSSTKNSSQGCKLTNLQAEAAQCKPLPLLPTSNGTSALLDSSATEHSVDSELQMHVAPIELMLRPNGQAGRPHRSRARVQRAGRLAVLREYAYDVPTSVESSEPNRPCGSRRTGLEGTRRSRRAYRERFQSRSQGQLDSSDGSSVAPRRCRSMDVASGLSAVSSGSSATGEAEVSGGEPPSDTNKKNLEPHLSVENEGHSKSYGLNLTNQNGLTKDSGRDLSLVVTGDSGNIKTGLWKHETTV